MGVEGFLWTYTGRSSITELSRISRAKTNRGLFQVYRRLFQAYMWLFQVYMYTLRDAMTSKAVAARYNDKKGTHNDKQGSSGSYNDTTGSGGVHMYPWRNLIFRDTMTRKVDTTTRKAIRQLQRNDRQWRRIHVPMKKLCLPRYNDKKDSGGD